MAGAKDKLKIFVLGTHPFIANRGCTAMCMGLLEVLRKGFPEEWISICNYNNEQQYLDGTASEYDLKYSTDLKMCLYANSRNSKIRQLIEFFGLIKSAYLAMLWRLFSYGGIDLSFILKKVKMLKGFFDTDIVLDFQWGDHFTDTYGTYVTLVWLHESLIPIMLRKPYVLLPQTIGPFNSALTRRLAKFILDKASIVMVREKETKNYLINMGIDEKRIHTVPDCAFYLNMTKDPSLDDTWDGPELSSIPSGRPLVGITLRDISFPGHTRSAQRSFLEMMATVVRHIQKKYNATVLLISHDGATFSRDVYNEFATMLGGDDGTIYLWDQPYSTEKTRKVISRCHITLSAYMHANIAAFAMNVPTIGFSYSYKTKGIFEMMGQGRYLCDLNTLSADKTMNLVDALWSNRDRESLKIKDQMEMIRGQYADIPVLIKEGLGI